MFGDFVSFYNDFILARPLGAARSATRANVCLRSSLLGRGDGGRLLASGDGFRASTVFDNDDDAVDGKIKVHPRNEFMFF